MFEWLLLALLAAEASNITAEAPLTPAGMMAQFSPRIPREPLRLALEARGCAMRSGVDARGDLLVLVDYSRPSTQKRLWVIDVTRGRVLFEELVAHGKNSGLGAIPTRFSNRPDSLMSSLGLFVTGESYFGEKGYGLRLQGMEPGFNDNSERRAIVMHGAWYVNDAMARRQGRLGTSWGCPVVRPQVTRKLIDSIKGGAFLFVYYPDRNWLQRSPYLGGCLARAD